MLKNSLPDLDLNPGRQESLGRQKSFARQSNKHCSLLSSLAQWATETGEG